MDGNETPTKLGAPGLESETWDQHIHQHNDRVPHPFDSRLSNGWESTTLIQPEITNSINIREAPLTPRTSV